MKLVDMKLPKKTVKEMKQELKTSPNDLDNGPEYPYGLTLSFKKESIDKLKLLQNVKANAEVKIQATGYVREVSILDTADEERKRRRVEIQITAIGITNDKAEEDAAEEAFDEGAKD